MALKPICKKCIHDFGNGCEAFRDEYKKIYDKRNCDDFNDGLLPPNPNMHDDEDE
jgi:hypothetical protein